MPAAPNLHSTVNDTLCKGVSKLPNQRNAEVHTTPAGSERREIPPSDPARSYATPSTMYKASLNNLWQRRRWAAPVYTDRREGPDHAPTFHSTVAVGGAEFSSPASGSRTLL
uniref:DRBM domain-containing protein n=1 Tax=Triticum aestivum TaxID=4565 RepID=A0A080YUJ5_WHEAT|nr:unnamed protein product [Triticum aestivum]